MTVLEVEPEIRSTVGVWADANPRLVEFQRLLVRGGEMDAVRAKGLVVELLTAIVDNAEQRYVEVLGSAVEEITAIRSELRTKYQGLLDFFDPRKPGKPVELPTELQPEAFESAFDRLQQKFDVIRQASFEDAVDAMDDPSRLEAFQAELEPEETPEVKPTLELDEPPEDRPVRYRGEGERVERLAYMERQAVQPEDPALRRRVDAVARIWGRRNLSDNYEVVGVYRSPEYGAYRTATEAFSALDPVFTGRGYELRIRNTRTGVEFRPDAVVDAVGGKYAFYERKSPLGDQPSGFYASQDGKVALVNKLIENAQIARDNAASGCAGWVYETGQPWLDASITDMIRYIRGEITIEALGLDDAHAAQLRVPLPGDGQFLVPPGESGVR
jgi:hypothetical protein